MKLFKTAHCKLIIILFCIFLLDIILYLQKVDVIPVFNIKATTQAEIKDELIVASFIKNIKADCNAFYNNYFSIELEIFNYEIKVKEVSKQVGLPYIYVTFRITPMIGAHNPVGYDEATYKIDVFGNISLVEFKHIKSFEIDQRFQEFMIKPLPATE